MKLSLTLSTLLLGSALMFTGCGSDSDTTPTTTGATEQAVKLTASMLAGKTLSVYGYQNGGTAGDNRMSMIVSDDASTCDIKSPDLSEVYADDAVLSVTDDSLTISFDGNTVSYSVVSIDDNGLYVTNTANMGNSIDAYPIVMAFETQADTGAALLNSLATATTVTSAKLSAAPLYSVDFGSGWAECWAIDTFKTDGTYSGIAIDGELETFTATYSVSGNVISLSGVDGVSTTSVLSLTDDLMITSWSYDDEGGSGVGGTRSYTSKQDALDFAMSYGEDCSGYFTQLEEQ